MRERLIKLLRAKTSLDFGFCSFDRIKENLIDCRAKLRIPQNAKTVISFVFPYRCSNDFPLNISLYASVKDYHIVCGKILEDIKAFLEENFKDFKFEAFLDNSPINEVKAAALSSLGVIGKNNLLITKKYGSFVFIGEIITDLEVEIHPTKIKGCISCGRCSANCPTGKIENKKNPCLSEITQKKRDLTKDEENLILKNKCVWGCDKCQTVCPMNKDKQLTDISEFISSYRNRFNPDENKEDRAYMWRGPKVITRNYEILEKSKDN